MDIARAVLEKLGKLESLIRYAQDRPGHDKCDASLSMPGPIKPVLELVASLCWKRTAALLLAMMLLASSPVLAAPTLAGTRGSSRYQRRGYSAKVNSS